MGDRTLLIEGNHHILKECIVLNKEFETKLNKEQYDMKIVLNNIESCNNLFFRYISIRNYRIYYEYISEYNITFLLPHNSPVWVVEQIVRLALHAYLLSIETLLLHGSCIKSKKGLIIFLGPSGVGKTTAAKLSNMPILQDDTFALSKHGEEYLAYTIPFRTEYNQKRITSPIHAIYSLNQSPTNLVSHISKSNQLQIIISSIWTFDKLSIYKKDNDKKAISLLLDLLSSVEVKKLNFNLSKEYLASLIC